MAIFVTIPPPIDDDGTGTTGTVINNGWLQIVLKPSIDIALSTLTEVTPPQITADQNDYNPTGLATAQLLNLATDASRTITGIVAQSGRRLILNNAGVNNIVLAHLSGSSSAANRISCLGAANLTVGVAESVELYYIASAGFWKTLAQA